MANLQITMLQKRSIAKHTLLALVVLLQGVTA